jgi:2-C-methyl-D-erythritol 4-phosphate cytidylyltransferase
MRRNNGRLESAKTIAILPAAGSGRRMKSPTAKQFLEIEGRPLLAFTLQSFQDCDAVDAVILVVPARDVDFCRREIVGRYRLPKVARVVAGGSLRQDSVRAGLAAVQGSCEWVLVHDGVRPVIRPRFIARIIDAARKHGAVTAAVPAKETLKEADEQGRILKTLDRRRIWLTQTPQVFRYADLLRAHREADAQTGEEATDDAALVERLGIAVKVLQGPEDNIKVTTPADLLIAGCLLAQGYRRPTCGGSA